MKYFLLYCLVGILNTIIGFGVIFLLTFYEVMPELANFLGYCIGIICSFFLNSFFTFKQKSTPTKMLYFIIAMGISYTINLIVLIIAHRIIGLDVYLSQILSGISYTLTGFILSKFYVWKT